MIRKFTSKNQRIGELGEDIACKYLSQKGFDILERNYTRKWGEIDIIAKNDGGFRFIEVKSVSSDLDNLNGKDKAYRPEENMHPQKIRKMVKVVQTYLISKRVGNTPWQIDLALVYIDKNKRLARVKILENLIF